MGEGYNRFTSNLFYGLVERFRKVRRVWGFYLDAYLQTDSCNDIIQEVVANAP